MALTTESALRKDKANAGKATFEHRHFATIANIIAGMDAEDFEALKDVIARYFAAELRHTNPRFDKARFLKACGVIE